MCIEELLIRLDQPLFPTTTGVVFDDGDVCYILSVRPVRMMDGTRKGRKGTSKSDTMRIKYCNLI